MLTLEDFLGQSFSSWDLIFYDLGNMQTRIRYISLIFDLAFKSNSTLVLDDIHKKNYRKFVYKLLKKYDGGLFYLKSYTLDIYGRFCGIVLFS